MIPCRHRMQNINSKLLNASLVKHPALFILIILALLKQLSYKTNALATNESKKL